MLLAIHEESGRLVQVGDKVRDFRGEYATVTGFLAPRGASTGRVYVDGGSTFGRGFYPDVFGIKLKVVEDVSH
jgi:hypothetical protein